MRNGTGMTAARKDPKIPPPADRSRAEHDGQDTRGHTDQGRMISAFPAPTGEKLKAIGPVPFDHFCPADPSPIAHAGEDRTI